MVPSASPSEALQETGVDGHKHAQVSIPTSESGASGWRGSPGSVPTEPQPLTTFEAARRAAEAVDPEGGDELVADFLLRFEDRDEPISGVPDIEQQVAEAVGAIDPDGDDPALVMAGAVLTYLAFRRDESSADPERLLQLAADAEFDGTPPDNVAAWLAGAA
jgi:hypothetical protein